MFDAIARRVLGSANDRYVRGLSRVVDQINALETQVERLSDEGLAALTPTLKNAINGRHGSTSRYDCRNEDR